MDTAFTLPNLLRGFWKKNSGIFAKKFKKIQKNFYEGSILIV